MTDTGEIVNIRLNTKGFCIYCLKRGTVLSQPEVGNDGGTEVETDSVDKGLQLRTQFSRVISRYLGTNYGFMRKSSEAVKQDRDILNRGGTVTRNVDVGCVCHDCSMLLGTINKLFDEMKKLELLLDYEARQLKNIMAFSKRALTRKKVFQEQFAAGGDLDKEEMNKIRKYRRGILKKFSEKFETIQPRIVFKRSSPFTDRPQAGNDSSPEVKRPTTSVQNRNPPITEVSKDLSKLLPSPPRALRSKVARELAPPPVTENYDADDAMDVGPPSPCSVASEVQSVQIRIRPLESLTSPTKSPPSTPCRVTRSAAKKVDTTAETNSVTLDPPSPAITPPVNLPSNCQLTSDQATEITSMLNRKATLTEWLEKTYPCVTCKKLFISKETLTTHQSECTTEPAQTPPMQEASDNESDGESPIELAVEDIPEVTIDDDPLDDTNDVERTMCTIRIVQKPPPPEQQQPEPVVSKMRFCKYCKKRITVQHFGRHRLTLAHKQNKREHKKAKKQKNLKSGPPSVVISETTPVMTTDPPIVDIINGNSPNNVVEDKQQSIDSVAEVQNVVGDCALESANDIIISDSD